MKSDCGPVEYFFKSSFSPTFFDTAGSANRCTYQEFPEPALLQSRPLAYCCGLK